LDITYLVGGGLKLSGRLLNLVCDPVGDVSKLGADAVLLTSPEVARPKTEAMIVDGPGEYEIKESLVIGVATQMHTDETGKRGAAYVVEIDGLKVGFLGNIAPKLTNEQLEVFSGVDVLAVPVGGHGLTLDATAASQVVSQIEPKYVIPTHYDDGVSKYAMPQDKLAKFLSEVGSKPEPQAKLKLNAKEMPLETTIVVLEPQ
jgi:L-ascorbate metabolism protein UlaG (beta-lactamase superfamily)